MLSTMHGSVLTASPWGWLKGALSGQGYSVVAFLESIQRQVDKERREGDGST